MEKGEPMEIEKKKKKPK